MVDLQPRRELFAPALGVLAACMQRLPDGVDEVVDVGRHAIEGRKLCQRVLQLLRQRLRRRRLHRVDDDVAQVLVALPHVDLALFVALRVAHRLPRRLAELRLARLHRCLSDQPLGSPRGVARVGEQQRLLAQPVQPDRFGRWPARCSPTALTKLRLVRSLPLLEQPASVREDFVIY